MGLEDFLEYANRNAGSRITYGRHRRILENVKENPRCIGLHNYDNVFCEVQIGNITSVDVVVFSDGEIYLVEVKGGNNRKHRIHASHRFVKENFDISPRLILVYSEGKKIKHRELPTLISLL